MQKDTDLALLLISGINAPTDEQVAEAVDAWLTDHPEATTTVEDGSITEAKLATGLANKLAPTYVYPVSWEIGSIITSDGNNYDGNKKAIRTPSSSKIVLDAPATFVCNNENITGIAVFKYNKSTNAFVGYVGGGSSLTPISLTTEYAYRLVAYADNAPDNITSSTIGTYTAELWLCAPELAQVVIDSGVGAAPMDYVVQHKAAVTSGTNNFWTFDPPIPAGAICHVKNLGNTMSFNGLDASDNVTGLVGYDLTNGSEAYFVAPFEIKKIRCYVSGNTWAWKLEYNSLTLVPWFTKRHTDAVASWEQELIWEVGTIVPNTGADTASNLVLRTKGAGVYLPTDAIATSINPLISNVWAFKYAANGRAFIERIGIKGGKAVSLPGGYYYRFVLWRHDESANITSGTISSFSADFHLSGLALGKALKDQSLGSWSSGVSGIRQNVTVKHLGALTGLQSFCVYNGKYYSTDGSHIYVQAADLTLENTATLDLDHGNSFQLGDGGIAYVSGCDNNKLYVVDLSDLSIDSIIDLPVSTGTTTAVVDEKNKIAYIVHTYTDNGAETYDFIVYDYDNEQVISTKKFPRRVSYCQGMDFVEGRIYIAYGHGTTDDPSAIIVCDANATVLGELRLGVLNGGATYNASTEIEGVFVKRDGSGILFSTCDLALYSVE